MTPVMQTDVCYADLNVNPLPKTITAVCLNISHQSGSLRFICL